MTGVNGSCAANHCTAPDIWPGGTNALLMNGSSWTTRVKPAVPSMVLDARPNATASQLSASTSRAVTPAAASHWPASACGRNPSPIATATTRTALISVRSRALTTCPFRAEDGEIAMVRNRAMMPSVESRLTDCVVTELPYAAVITKIPGMT